MNVLDLFSGIGGFSLGLERAGMKTIAFCEKGRVQREVLKRHWPNIRIYDDATNTNELIDGIAVRPDVIAGGDPCPIRSRARGSHRSRHPDLSGYFLAVVGRLRPWWILRENVPAPDDKEFATALGVLGYRVFIVGANAASFTGQERPRDFVIGCRETAKHGLQKLLQGFEAYNNPVAKSAGTRPVAPCLTTNRMRYDSRDCYIWDGRLRIPDNDERTALAGFPEGWLAGLSESAVARVTGNAVVPQIPEIIGRAIMHVDGSRPGHILKSTKEKT